MHPNRPRGAARKNIQKKGRRYLKRLLARQDSKCHWCKKHLIHFASFDKSLIIRHSKEWVIWNDNGEEKKSYWATSDHLIPIRNNGQSTLSNLVAACGQCNRRRDRVNNPDQDRPKWIGHPKCKCGRDKPIEMKRCAECKQVSKELITINSRYYISKNPINCRKCNAKMVVFPESTPIGIIYYCPDCVRV